MQDTDKNFSNNIYKNSSIIAISNNITLLQRKLFNFLVGHAFVYLQEQEIHNISISSLKNRLWFNSSNDKYLKESLRKLITTAVEFNLLWKDKEEWEASSLISSVRFRSWVCHYSFSPILREKLHKPNIYSKLNLNLIKLFSSKYSLCLYELAIDYMKIKCTPFIPLDIFKKLMGVEKNKYSEFKRLKQRVISPAIKELNTIAWFSIWVEYQKEWRKVIAIKFLLHEVKIEPSINLVNPDTQDKLLAKIQDNHLLQKSLIDNYGLTLRQANKVIKDYPIAYIKESIEIVRLKRLTGVIKNLPAYTLAVLKKDYVPTSTMNKQKQSILWSAKTSLFQKKDKRDNKVSMDDDKISSKNSVYTLSGSLNTIQTSSKDEIKKDIQSNSQIITKYTKTVQSYINSLSTTQKDSLVKEFEKEKITNPILQDLYKKKGIDEVVFRVMFEGWINEKIKNN